MRRATHQFRWKILQISIQVLLYDKLTAWLDLLYKLHRTVWGVPPASSDGKYYRFVYYNKLTARNWVVLILHLSFNYWCHVQIYTSIRKISLKLMLLLMFDAFSVERSLTIFSDLKDWETFLDFTQKLLRNDSYISTGNHWFLPWTFDSAIITGCLKKFTWPQLMSKD